MATTGFWPVKGHLKDVLLYAENPDKTTARRYLDDDLFNALRYVENDGKTDQRMYVSAINCPKQRSYECMIATKRRYGKLGGNVAYHGYQSFQANEVTPEEAHKIGMETARRMWGDEYEIVVTTHLNTDNIHNHMVVNSVSFKTGRKFENHIRDHIRLREISDAVCLENNKSVLKDSPFYGSEKKAYWIRRSGQLTHRDMLKQDVERCLSIARTPEEFERNLKAMGYIFIRPKENHKHLSVKAPGWQRAVRLYSIGYPTEVINARMLANREDEDYYRRRYQHPVRKPKHTPLLTLEMQYKKLKKLDAVDIVFLLIIELIKLIIGNNIDENISRPLSPAVRQEVAKLDRITQQYSLILECKLETMEDVHSLMDILKDRITTLENERQHLRNKLRRVKSPEEETELKQKCREMSEKLKPFRDRLRTVSQIEGEYLRLKALLETERQMERAVLQRQQER